jgi:serine/threonine-protein kinase
MTDLTGQVLCERYRIDAFLGRGGMADVYKAWDRERMVHLALKLLREDLAEDRIFLRRFEREAKVLETLQHPNIVRYFGLEHERLLAFMLMDFIDGSTLRAFLMERGERGLPMSDVLRIMRPVLAAMHYAHVRGIIHCDIKPANIMFDRGGRVYVTDFGIARLAEAATVTLVSAGTPAYMSPEQCRGSEELDGRTDLYALGIVLYEMLTGGERPFKGDTAHPTGTAAERIRWQHLNEVPPSPRTINPEVSPAAEAIVMRCLEKRSSDRFPTATALLSALEQAELHPQVVPAATEGAPATLARTLVEPSGVASLAAATAAAAVPAATVVQPTSPTGQPGLRVAPAAAAVPVAVPTPARPARARLAWLLVPVVVVLCLAAAAVTWAAAGWLMGNATRTPTATDVPATTPVPPTTATELPPTLPPSPAAVIDTLPKPTPTLTAAAAATRLPTDTLPPATSTRLATATTPSRTATRPAPTASSRPPTQPPPTDPPPTDPPPTDAPPPPPTDPPPPPPTDPPPPPPTDPPPPPPTDPPPPPPTATEPPPPPP